MTYPKNITWRILHIDDDEDDYFITRTLLDQAQGQKITVEWASSFQEGRQKLRANPYHAVLVDYDLGSGSGIDLIREFVQQGYTAPLILYTGRGSYEVDLEAMHAGATLYLTKGEVSPLLLERSIRYAMERKQVEQDLLVRDKKLRLALDSAQLGTWTYNFADHMLAMDERAQQLYRANYPVMNHDEIVQNYLHPDDFAPMCQGLQTAADPTGSGQYQLEYRIRQADGSYCWLKAWGMAQFEGVGDERRATHLSGVSRDITGEKHAAETLLASQEHFRALADSMPQLVWTAQADGTVDYYNRRYREYAGIDLESGGAWNWSPVLHPDDLQLTQAAWLHALETGETYKAEHRVRMAGGGYRWHLSRGVPAHDAQGKIIKWYGTATDIHDLKLAQEELHSRESELEALVKEVARSNQDLEQFAFTASHDLHEPLRKVKLFGEHLQRRLGEYGDDETRELFQRMNSAAGRMQSMIDALLELSRVNTHARAFVSVNLNQVIEDVLFDLEEQIQQANGQVTVEPLPNLPGDPVQLRQLFQNLLGNALKFHRPGIPPRVYVYSRPGLSPNGSGETVSLVVDDNGIGFEEEYAGQIFQPFRRLHDRSSPYDGSGIGLAICQKITERHDGSITAYSRPGQGSSFVITLPVR